MSEQAFARDISLPSSNDIRARAHELVTLAVASHVTLGTAESCTGGLVSGAITSIPGSSEALIGGVVSYSLSVKENVLGVERSVLDGVGAVSRECAAQMASGARGVLRADVAVSITGIAGPGGEEPGKPVGTVWFGLSTGKSELQEVHCFSGGRDEVRAKAVFVALGLLRVGIKDLNSGR